MRYPPAAAVAAAALLAGCGSYGASAGAPASPAVSTTAHSCHAQYEAWKHGTASAELTTFKSALRAIAAAGQARDVLKLRAALNKAGRSASRLAAIPPPRCADPKGYYKRMLAGVTAAGDNMKAAGGIGGVLMAVGTLKTVPAIEKKLSAELDKTVGVKR